MARRGTDIDRHAAARAARHAEQTRAFGAVVMGGLIIYGAVHLLLTWVVLQLAWSGSSGQQASEQGALAELAQHPFGSVLLWVVGIGLFALVIWQLLQVLWGYRDMARLKRYRKRATSVGRAIIYVAIGISAVGIALPSGGQAGEGQSGGSTTKTMTSQLMSETWGRIAVFVIGLIIVGIGGALIYRGLAQRFVEDLQESPSTTAVRFGQIGFTAKGAVLILVGALFCWATITYQRSKAGGLDSALRTVRDQPYGPVLLTIVALGFACFGCYCFAWSRHARH